MKVICGERAVIKCWCDEPEEGAIEQARHLANLPFLFRHVALMPDTHQGYGMPIGGVIATRGVVIPNAVGVDIGCGMVACQTNLTSPPSTDALKEIMGRIRECVPVGFNRHEKPQMSAADLQRVMWPTPDGYEILHTQLQKATHQLGTLGGGNHFIEIQKGSDGYIWIMIHSGSRNLGKQVADYYNNLAKELNEKWHSVVPKEHQLAFLPIETPEGQAYLSEMRGCLEFAHLNRQMMMDRVLAVMESVVGAVPMATINIHHNYASMENHFGENVIVHRKGATLAREGQFGIIPGSQGTSSYIVRGKGNPDSFNSCSHGAGRRMGRKQAQRELNLEVERSKLDAKGIIHSIRNIKDLDEASGAYKDIDVVMREQRDLVDIEVRLEPLGVVKG